MKLIKKIKFVLVLLFIMGLNNISAQNKSDVIVGKWYTDKNESVVEIIKRGDKFFGKLIWLKEATYKNGKNKRDKHNPDESKHNNPLIGVQILSNFEYDDDDNEWTDGKVYDAKTGKIYSGTLTLKNKNTMDMRGYIGFSFIGKSTIWKRKQN